jgi:hypothetical protein
VRGSHLSPPLRLVVITVSPCETPSSPLTHSLSWPHRDHPAFSGSCESAIPLYPISFESREESGSQECATTQAQVLASRKSLYSWYCGGGRATHGNVWQANDLDFIPCIPSSLLDSHTIDLFVVLKWLPIQRTSCQLPSIFLPNLDLRVEISSPSLSSNCGVLQILDRPW